MTDTEYRDLSPETRALIAKTREVEPLMKTPEFEQIPLSGEPGILGTLLYTRACTSLSDEEATARINLLPPMGDHGEWVLLTKEGEGGPVPCQDKPDTHRHLMWEC